MQTPKIMTLMTTKTLVLCALFCLLGFHQLQANIEIINVKARTGRGCNGSRWP